LRRHYSPSDLNTTTTINDSYLPNGHIGGSPINTPYDELLYMRPNSSTDPQQRYDVEDEEEELVEHDGEKG